MATTIQSIEILREYLSGVLDRADHHAQNVNEISLAIVGGIVWKSTSNIRVLSREGEMKNVLWLKANNRTLCFTYNHSAGCIEVKEENTQGSVIQKFSNSTSIAEVREFFESL